MEGRTKTRQGGLSKKPKVITQKLFCTVARNAQLQYVVSKYPLDVKFHSPLYLTPLRKETWDNEEAWFLNISFEVNSICIIIPRMVVAAWLSGPKKHYTNHIIRKTAVKKLKKAGVNPSEIIAITGHKNWQSLVD